MAEKKHCMEASEIPDDDDDEVEKSPPPPKKKTMKSYFKKIQKKIVNIIFIFLHLITLMIFRYQELIT